MSKVKIWNVTGNKKEIELTIEQIAEQLQLQSKTCVVYNGIVFIGDFKFKKYRDNL